MPENKLKELVSTLHAELQKPGGVDADTAELLRTLGNDIEGKLSGTHDETLTERVAAAIERFEGKHPDLTAILNRIANTLSSLGI